MSLLSRATKKAWKPSPNDYYRTIDPRAVAPLAEHLRPGLVYAEPCAGAGDLIELLRPLGLKCAWGLELAPPIMRWPIARGNALDLTEADCEGVDEFITNPPWSRPLLHALIMHLAALRPSWFLFDASWKHTQQAARFGPVCSDVVNVGRLKWFADTAHGSTSDCAWYRFDARPGHWQAPTRYHWPALKKARAAPPLLLR